MKQIWLDCDTGHDDAFAILLAACHPDIQLLGISTVFGNAPLENTTYNTRAILKTIGREDVPVYAGAAKPFCRDAFHAPHIHGESGLDGVTLPIPEVGVRSDDTAVNAMYKALISTPKNTAWLVVTGAMTNAALLFATHTNLATHLAGISIMAGAIGGNFTDAVISASVDSKQIGNITPWAEFNVYIDPESAKSLLNNPIIAARTTLITLDLTHLFLATESVREALLHGKSKSTNIGSSPSMVRQIFVDILQFFAKTNAEVFGITTGPPVHDVLAVAAIIVPELFDNSPGSLEHMKYAVDVITDGAHNPSSRQEREASQCGRTIALPLAPNSKAGGIRIPKSVDTEKVWHLIDQCLSFAEKSVV